MKKKWLAIHIQYYASTIAYNNNNMVIKTEVYIV